MVTAGVYLLIRFNEVLLDSGIGELIIGVGVLTILVSGVRANFESDIKKIIALSTLSQLGLIIITLGIGLKRLAFFHLVRHAMFKASLFICAGFIIHRIKGTQDSRKIRGLRKGAPFLGLVFGVINIALAGFPFLAGFYSKDIILERVYFCSLNIWVLVGRVVATGLTVCYRVRVMFLGVRGPVMLRRVRGREEIGDGVVKSVSLLVIGGVLVGYIFSWLYLVEGGCLVLTTGFKRVTIIIIYLGLVLGLGLGGLKFVVSNISYLNSLGLKERGFLSYLSSNFITKRRLLLRGCEKDYLRGGWFEYYGGQGGRRLFIELRSNSQGNYKRGLVSHYLVFFFIIWLVCFMLAY